MKDNKAEFKNVNKLVFVIAIFVNVTSLNLWSCGRRCYQTDHKWPSPKTQLCRGRVRGSIGDVFLLVSGGAGLAVGSRAARAAIHQRRVSLITPNGGREHGSQLTANSRPPALVFCPPHSLLLLPSHLHSLFSLYMLN